MPQYVHRLLQRNSLGGMQMVRAPRSKRPTPPSADDVDTIELSQKEYRDWVNDQVASALLKRILLIGFGGIVAVTSLYFAAQNFLLDFQKDSIVKNVQSGMTEQISTGISDVLISKSAIIDSLANQGVKVANALLENPEFVSSVQERILAEVIKDNSLDRVILATARGQVESATQPATKAMGLRLYSLFHGNVRWDDEVQPLRSVYRAALGDGEVGRDEQLLAVVLQQYPLGVRSDPECVTLPARCDAYDKDVLGRVLAILGEGELPGTITSDLERFLSSMPEASLAQSLTWLELNAARPLARFILETWLKGAPSASRQFEFGITGLETLLRSEDVRAQDEALRILAEMDAEAPFPNHSACGCSPRYGRRPIGTISGRRSLYSRPNWSRR
jgi:hypothetical protein